MSHRKRHSLVFLKKCFAEEALTIVEIRPVVVPVDFEKQEKRGVKRGLTDKKCADLSFLKGVSSSSYRFLCAILKCVYL